MRGAVLADDFQGTSPSQSALRDHAALFMVYDLGDAGVRGTIPSGSISASTIAAMA
ncbi:hypothetical protein ACVWZA_000041 [Sphingomonas sp. UYAg733]